ncbi:LysR family substrate-binding domain-containing protein [Streptomyces sp. NPDC048594]|uniref:LysR family substrate-binding domain-containing protein n=1 Tax=Streptomyces sp. NPDC048594 TaxID=3365575 RepID=UPI00371E8A81
MAAAGQLEGLRQRSLDIALVREPPERDDPLLRAATLLEDPLLLVLPAGHPLAASETISAKDLDGQPWIAVEGAGDRAWRDAFVASCVASGFTPDIRLDAADPLTALGLVASGLGLAWVQKSMVRGATEAVAVRALPWYEVSIQLWAVWHHVDLRPVVASFRATVLSHEREVGAVVPAGGLAPGV